MNHPDMFLAITILKTNTGHRFKSGWFGKQILQVSDICQSWNTITGLNVGPEFVSWRNASKKEVGELCLVNSFGFKVEPQIKVDCSPLDSKYKRFEPGHVEEDEDLKPRPFLRLAIEANLPSIYDIIKRNFKSFGQVMAEKDLESNVCDECSPDDYGWNYNRVDGRVPCVCIAESGAYQELEVKTNRFEELLVCCSVQLCQRVIDCSCSTLCRDCNDNNKLVDAINKARIRRNIDES